MYGLALPMATLTEYDAVGGTTKEIEQLIFAIGAEVPHIWTPFTTAMAVHPLLEERAAFT